MKIFTALRNLTHKAARKALSMLPRRRRFGIYRSFVECDPAPNTRLVLKIADTREELEACLSLLHDSYVDSGFMTPDPSGMRVTSRPTMVMTPPIMVIISTITSHFRNRSAGGSSG